MTAGARDADRATRAVDELEALVARVEGLVRTTEPEAWSKPPARGGWSAAQCLDHLSTTAEDAARRLLAASSAPGRSLRRPGARWWVRLFARTLEPPARLRTRTKPSFEPPDPQPIEGVLERFRAAHLHLAGDLRAVPEDLLHRVSIDSPFGPVHYTPLEWGLVLAAHGRRHVWQAERALQG
jgi:hypothetical protein